MTNSKIAPCCAEPGNREIVETRPAVNRANPDEKGDLVVERCKVCSRKHYTLNVEPIKIDLTGKGL